MQDEVKDLLSNLERTKKEIAEIRMQLNDLDKNKEAHFAKRSSVQEKISTKIKLIKELKVKRNKQTDQVKELKKERDDLNKTIGGEVAKLKDVKVEQAPTGPRKDSYGFLKSKIRKLEEELEISAMKFEREKKLNKELKLLKKKADALKTEFEKTAAVKDLSKDIKYKRKRADDVHKQIQDHAKQSQKFHEELLVLSDEIDKLKDEEHKETEMFTLLKKEFSEVNSKLKTSLDELNRIKGELDRRNVKLKEEKEQEERAILKQKDTEVQEKLKKKKKLTTDDILILQSVEERR